LPEAELHLLALKGGIADMGEASGWFQKIHLWDPDHESLRRGVELLFALRKQRFTDSLALFPTSHPKFAVFHRAINSQRRWGFAYPKRLSRLGLFRALPIDWYAHDSHQNLRLIENLTGVSALKVSGSTPSQTFTPTFPLPLIFPESIPQGNYLTCHPGSSAARGMAEKRLPPSSFAVLIRKIHRRFGWSTVLVGGPEERELRASVTALCPEAIVDVPTRSLAECAGVMARSQLFLGNDSGLMHIAASLNRPCAAIFGPTDEKRNGPYGYWEKGHSQQTRHLILRRQDLACAPCRTARNTGDDPGCIYGDWRCLKKFPLDKAWASLEPFLISLGASAATSPYPNDSKHIEP
jgi:ADP-heptose:LPS heptosyltransferase